MILSSEGLFMQFSNLLFGLGNSLNFADFDLAVPVHFHFRPENCW